MTEQPLLASIETSKTVSELELSVTTGHTKEGLMELCLPPNGFFLDTNPFSHTPALYHRIAMPNTIIFNLCISLPSHWGDGSVQTIIVSLTTPHPP